MKQLGILAHSTEGAALCLRAFCQEGFAELGPHDHPDVTLDCIAIHDGRSDLSEEFSRRGIACELPDSRDRELVDRAIFDELVYGVFSASSRKQYLRIIGHLAERGCDAVALVCTEISLLVTPDDSPVPTLDSTRLLARAAFETAVGRRAFPTWRGGPIVAA